MTEHQKLTRLTGAILEWFRSHEYYIDGDVAYECDESEDGAAVAEVAINAASLALHLIREDLVK